MSSLAATRRSSGARSLVRAFLLPGKHVCTAPQHSSRAASIQPACSTFCAKHSAYSNVAGAGIETRCAHCFITFATPAELSHHTTHHCFPDDPAEVLRRFPEGAEAIDIVSQQRVVIVGTASNRHKAHSSVSARDVTRGLVADTPISRLQLATSSRPYVTSASPVGTVATTQRYGVRAAARRYGTGPPSGIITTVAAALRFRTPRSCRTPRRSVRFCSSSAPPSFRTEPLIQVPQAKVDEVADLLLLQGLGRYLDCRSEVELSGGVIPNSINIPFPHNGNTEIVQPADFLLDLQAEGFERDTPIFVGCRSGARSALAVEVLINAGYTDVRNVEGGILAWAASGLPIEPFAG